MLPHCVHPAHPRCHGHCMLDTSRKCSLPTDSPLAVSVLNVQPQDVVGDAVLVKTSINSVCIGFILVVPPKAGHSRHSRKSSNTGQLVARPLQQPTAHCCATRPGMLCRVASKELFTATIWTAPDTCRPSAYNLEPLYTLCLHCCIMQLATSAARSPPCYAVAVDWCAATNRTCIGGSPVQTAAASPLFRTGRQTAA